MRWTVYAFSALLSVSVFLTGCATSPTEHYVSPKIQGQEQRINLDQVQKAFWDTKGKDFSTWMAAFEKRVNEIYDGKDIVQIDATRQSGKLVVTGFIDKDKQEGFKPGDDKLFAIEQTGEAVNNEMPYRVAGQDGSTYYQGQHSFLDNPILQMMLVSHMMGGWGGRYYTPAPQTIVLQQHRDSFRQSPAFGTQQQANRSFLSRFKTNAGTGQLESRNRFGSSSPFSSDSGSSATEKRRFFGGSSSNNSTSSFGSSFGGLRRSGGWGRRRR